MSLTPKRLYHWLPWASALGLALVFLVFMRSDLNVHETVWHERLAWNANDHRSYLDASGRDLTQQAMLLAQLVVRDTVVVQEIRQSQALFAQSGEPEQLAQARAKLQARLRDYWDGVDDLGVRQLTVYFAPGVTAFLRMHHPERFGDSLMGQRPIISDAFNSGLPAWGMDVSRHGSGYRAVLPVMTNEDQSGGVIAVLEISMSPIPPANGAEPRPLEVAMFLRKPVFEQVLWEQVRQNLNRANPTVVDDWRLEEASDNRVSRWWSSGLVAINQKAQLLREGEQSFLVSWWPLEQVGLPKEQSGLAMVVWSDISAAHQAYLSIRKRVTAKWLAALVSAQLLLVLFVHFNRRHLRQVIAEHSEQMRTEHAQSEQARQRLALALRSSDSGFWEWDIANDKARFSPEWRQLCGIGPESPHSLDLDEWMSRVHPADKRLSYSDIIRHIKGETPMYENEYRLKVQDGSYKWILTRGKVVEWQPDGRAALMLGVYSDITDRKNTELVSIRQQAALHSLNEIASLSAVDPAEQLRLALSLGARYLGLSSGLISEINGEDYRVHVQFSSAGTKEIVTSNHLSKNYCSLTVAQRDVIAEDDIPASEYRNHAAYLLTQIESYIGVPLWINDRVYGTLCFFARKTRHHQYDSLDRDFVRLLARWISSVVERWQQEREKKIILNRFQKLSERLPGFLYQFQLRPDGTSFFPYASPGMKNIYNVAPEEVTVSAQKVFAAIHPDDVGWVSESVSYSASHLTPWVATVRINNPLRGMLWTHIESIPEKLEDGSVLWHGYVSDITPLKQAELQLQETNSLRKAILDAAGVAIISTDRDGLIKTFNQGAELMLGYTAAELVNKHTPEVLHLAEEVEAYAHRLTCELGYEVKPGFEAFVAKAREGSEDENEWHYRRKDGTQFPVVLTVSALRDSEGEVTGYLGIARDISEIKRIDQMKTEFISTVSHELRTPLTAISGALGILVNGMAGELSPPSVRMIQIAHNNSQRLIHLVNDLLDMEKLVAGKMPFNLQSQMLLPLIQQSLEANAAFAAQYGVTYQLAPGACDARVAVDAQRLLQVLANYLSNAAKFSPMNDQVTVNVEIRFGSVRVSVTDKGPGIPDNFRARLFQKFSQADSSDTRQKGGTGLGLSICKEIIERMGGKVGVDSTPGEGASFYFDLPCEEARQVIPVTRIEPTKTKPHALVLEEDPQIAKLLASALVAQGLEVDRVNNRQSALEHLQLRDYDLVALSLGPDAEELEIVTQIHRQPEGEASSLAPVPTIIISVDPDGSQQRLGELQGSPPVYWLKRPLASEPSESLAKQVEHLVKQVLGYPEPIIKGVHV